MGKHVPLLTALVVAGVLAHLPLPASAAYRLSLTTAATWDGTDANRQNAPTDDYKYTYGDEATVSFNLPWPFTFYGQTYSQGTPVTIDTNGNIWFSATGSAHSFALANTSGRGPVVSAWNNDLSSHFFGGAFVQRKSAPDRVVVEWQTESYTDEGAHRMNSFEAVLFPNGIIRFDYAAFGSSNGRDYGSGISQGDGTASLNLTTSVGAVPTLAGHSYTFTELLPALNVVFSGSGEGSVTMTPDGTTCAANCSASYASGTSVALHAVSSPYSTFIGWSSHPAGCSGTGECVVIMDDDKTATAQFTRDTAHQVSIAGQPTQYYSTIQAAYDAAADGNAIRLWAVVYTESVTCGRTVEVTFRGGYDVNYGSLVDNAVLKGVLTVADGTVVADGVSVR